MSKWEMVQLGDICIGTVTNIAQKDLADNNGKYPIYGASGFIKNVNFYKQEKPYIAVIKDGAGIGRVSRLPAKSSVIGTMQYILPNDNVNVDFLYHLLSRMNLARYYTGATIPHIYFKDYKKEFVPFPPLLTQKKIADVLDRVNSLMDKRRHQIEKLNLLVKAHFVGMFGDPMTNPMGWRTVILSNVCTKITDGTHFSPPSFDEGEYKYITAKNIKQDGFDFTNLTYINETEHRGIYGRCNPEYGDVLYIKDGVTTGIAQINTLREEFSLLSSVALLKPAREALMGYYLRDVLNNQNMYTFIRSNMGGAAITRLTVAKIKSITIPLPSINLQDQYENFVKEVDKTKFVLQKGLEKLELTHKALMQQYFG